MPVPVRAAVDPDRARIDEAAHTCDARRLESERGAADVDGVRPRGIGRDGVDVGDRGQVNDGIAPVHGSRERCAVEEVADDPLQVAVIRERRDEVEDSRDVAAGAQRVDDVRADEAGATGHEDGHPATRSSLAGSGR